LTERKILGVDIGAFFSRASYAALYGILTIVVFYELPDYLLKNYGTSVSGLPLGNSGLFTSYAILITALSCTQIVFQDHYLGDAAAVSNGIAQIFYIYIFTNGGIISETVSGIQLSIDFRIIIYLMMLPSALSIISAVISASSRSSITPAEITELKLE
jgi:hypothetical protein